MTITVQELIDQLQDMVENGEIDGDVEVRIAQQPSWPFEYDIRSIEIVDMDGGTCDVCDGAEDEQCPACRGSGQKQADETSNAVYLVEGSQIGYLPGVVADAIGWGRGR